MSRFIRPARWLRRPAARRGPGRRGRTRRGWLAAVTIPARLPRAPRRRPRRSAPDANVAAFGPNVYVFNHTMTAGDASRPTLNNIASQQVSNQFGSQRYAVFFEPGTYGSSTDPLIFQVGYYTTVAGLGLNPGDVTINGAIDVNNQCFGGSCTALDNFWRSLSNLTINVVTAELAASRTATSSGRCRRPHRCGESTSTARLFLFDYCTRSGLLQRRVHRRLPVHRQSGHQRFPAAVGDEEQRPGQVEQLVWNQVFCGDTGAPAQSFGVAGANQYTTLATCPVTEEEPFLYTDSDGSDNVFVPAVQHNSSGASWTSGTKAGTSIPLSKFFIASPGTSGAAMTAAMARGLNLILTPGVYDLNQPIVVPASRHRDPGPGHGHPGPAARQCGHDRRLEQRGEAVRPDHRRRPGQLAGPAVGRDPRTEQRQ